MNEKIKKRIKNLPTTPGVYIMRNADGDVIYVGKARVLKNRVRQYFTNEQQLAKVAAMVSRVDDFEYIITDTELEALILEGNLIKQYRPYYNILLKDDKQFPYIRIDLNEAYPRVEVVRSVKKDGAKYFGPFIAAHVIKDVLDDIYRLYPLRSCKKDIKRAIERKERPCLNYEMGRCCGPCTGNRSEEEYMEMVKEVIRVITGDKGALKKELAQQMEQAAEGMNYELAANLRDRIKLIDRIREKQKAGFPNLDDKDVFALDTGKETAVVQAFLFRDGKLSYARKYYMDFDGEEKAEIMGSFLEQYYMEKSGIPKSIYVTPRPEGTALLMEWLTEKRGSNVKIMEAQRGDNKKLQDLARKNAGDAIKIKEGAQKQRELATGNLANALGLNRELRRIECYDISNTQGTDNVSSMVVFTDGKPDKKKYRTFKIKTVEGANDFASMNETLERRLLRGVEGDEAFLPMPDLVIIDGGKGQLSAAVDALAAVGCDDIPVVSLAKKEEEIFIPGQQESILLKLGSPEFRLVTGIRDEAHRFAVGYHRKLREKRIKKSELDDVPGVGNNRKRLLLRYFGSLKKIKEASLDEIKAVKGIPQNVAETVFNALRGR
ncbi:excinuclease ABC subunit UvrC [Christensenellaceae bacterium OttesenSCG-928-K19]|nr:excinuclease ABC subunit UvrC [Christensenellaceae bacterium OttesenSCG-928-K19]